jgi:hypothetical protein
MREKRLTIILGASALMLVSIAAAGIGFAPPSTAWPAPPPPGCQQEFMVAYCDGPIEANGSWQRCFENQKVWIESAQTWMGGSDCYQVGPGPDPHPWAPQYHIGG